MIELWHGGNRWTGQPEIRPARKGRYEAGPGLYLTTSYLRARSYAKGSKVVSRVKLRDDIRWLGEVRLPVTVLVAFLDSRYRLPKRASIVADLHAAAEREQVTDLPVRYLVNLGVNYDSWGGDHGVALAKWLTEQGIDAALYDRSAAEHWVVIFNPKAIVSSTVVRPSEVTLDEYDLPLIKPTEDTV